jgi:hypothetical protein
MFNWVKSIFGKSKSEPKSLEDIVNEAPIGITVKLTFKDPRKVGLIYPPGEITRRYDPEDLEKRIIIGTLLTKRFVNGILFLEIGCFKMRNGMRIERTYTLMFEEIEKVELLT